MRKKINLIFKPFIFIFALIFAVSCSDFSNGPEESSAVKGTIFINVRTVNTTSGTVVSSKIKEKINTLRVILLNGNSIVLNELVTFDEQIEATEFDYLFKVPYSPSINRRFYFIANEAQLTSDVIEFQPQSNVTLPNEINGKSFTQIMDLYPTEIGDDDSDFSSLTGNATTLENILNLIYFEPVYNIIYDKDAQGQNLETGQIYLPYSIYYPESMITKTGESIDDDGNLNGYSTTMFMAPVATKFEFHFINNRIHDVELSNLKLTQFHNLNFLLARVVDPDIKKTYDSSILYWPDWLAKVSEESWNNADTSDENNTFNQSTGWISNYNLPNGSTLSPMTFPQNMSPQTLTIPALSVVDGEEVPGILNLGPYYVPESKNLVNGTQWYGMNFTVKDTYTQTEFNFELDDSGTPIAIENLGALFRNTHVVITVRMGEGEPVVDGVYAEIMPWIVRSSFGFVGGYVN